MNNLTNLALARIQTMRPYSPPIDGRAVYSKTRNGTLLDFNERTTLPSPAVIDAVQSYVAEGRFQVYPEYLEVERSIAQYVGAQADQILLTNGSDQGIELIFRTFTEAGDAVYIPEPSFAMFAQCAQVQGNAFVQDIDAPAKLAVICNPNNPTGTLTSLADIERLATAQPNRILLIDEAYAEFSGVSAAPLIERYPNIVVVRTFSKAFGLAALRIGYVVADARYIAELQKVRGPYDINTVGRVAAAAALADIRYMQTYVDEVMQQAKPLLEQFFTKNGIRYQASSANFILFWPNGDSDQIVRALDQAGYRLRPQNKPGIEGSVRVSIGTVSEMRGFINTYQQVVLKRSPKKLALLDRDGTLLFEPPDTKQIDDAGKLKLSDGVITGLQALQRQGYTLVMVTNQDGLGSDTFPQKKFDECQALFLQKLQLEGIQFEEILICPDLPEDNCDCRKPKTQLVDELLCDYAMDYSTSFVCGDRDSDSELAERLGITFIPAVTNQPLPNFTNLSIKKTYGPHCQYN